MRDILSMLVMTIIATLGAAFIVDYRLKMLSTIETIVVEPTIEIEGFTCHRRGELTINVEDYEVIVTAVCSMELIDAYYIALIPEATQ